MKKLKGFTLVELVVVIAIIAVLSTTLMPNMITWVRKSKYNTAKENAESIFNAAQTIAQKYESIDMAITKVDDKKFSGISNTGALDALTFGNLVDDNDNPLTFNDSNKYGAKEANDFYKKLKSFKTNLDNCYWAVEIKNYQVTHVVWAENKDDRYVGVYCSEEDCGHHIDANFESYIDDSDFKNNIKISGRWKNHLNLT